MSTAPELEALAAAMGPAVEKMVSIDPGAKLIFTIAEVEMRRVSRGCLDIADAMEPGVNRDNLLEVAGYAANSTRRTGRATKRGAYMNAGSTILSGASDYGFFKKYG